MTNAELITALRYCGNFEDREGCDEECPYIDDLYCPQRIMIDAAAALEAAEARIAELEAARMELTTKCRRLQAQLQTVTGCHALQDGERRTV